MGIVEQGVVIDVSSQWCIAPAKNLWNSYLQLAKSKGTWILEQAQSLEKHQRADLSKKTGFMGIVKIEVGYFIDFLQTQYIFDWKYQLLRRARLFIFVDDLDRCDPQTIMNVLQAIMLLLLVDAPITCILAIDSNFIVGCKYWWFVDHIDPNRQQK